MSQSFFMAFTKVVSDGGHSQHCYCGREIWVPLGLTGWDFREITLPLSASTSFFEKRGGGWLKGPLGLYCVWAPGELGWLPVVTKVSLASLPSGFCVHREMQTVCGYREDSNLCLSPGNSKCWVTDSSPSLMLIFFLLTFYVWWVRNTLGEY